MSHFDRWKEHKQRQRRSYNGVPAQRLDPTTGRHAFKGDADLCELCSQDRKSPWHERSNEDG